MTGFHHRIKTHGRWQVQQPFPGVYLWRDPHGACHLVEHTGTRRLRPAPEISNPPRKAMVMELWRNCVPVEFAA